MLELHASTRESAESAILISGSARSGTTIVGKLVHSFETVEYVFEPPALIALFPLIESLRQTDWNYLYEAYLYEEFLINAVSGRAINTNLADDSSIYAVKDKAEIDSRLARSWPKAEAAALAPQRRAAYKIPNIVPYIPTLRARYPGMSVIMMVRGALETIHSLLAKHSFTFGHPSADLPWPYRVDAGQRIPYWVKKGDEGVWRELNELDRCAYYYIRMSDGFEEADNQFVLKYSNLINNPRQVAESLAEHLGVNFGAKTTEIIKEIKPLGKPLDSSLLDKISSEFRMQVKSLSERAE